MLGVFKNLSNEEYHADTSAVSRSGLWEFRKAPAKYFNAYLNPERPEKKDTPDMAFGRAFHTFVLEPHLFEQQYIVQDLKLPEIDEKPLKRDLQAEHGKDLGAELYEEAKQKEAHQKALRDRLLADFSTKSAGKELITVDQMATLRLMRQSVLNHPEASQLVVGGAVEHSLFWEDPHTGVRCKTRPDLWFDNMTVDLKTTKSADERSFIQSVASYGYHWQSAMNREGIYHTGHNDIKKHTFICVEKEWPHLVAVYILDQSALDSAHTMFKNTLRDFKICRDTNDWPGYATKEISLPAWAE
jgi:hypothetical protein